jgi:hypothetical protein
MLLFALRFASLIYFVSASAALSRPQSPRSPRVRGELRSLAFKSFDNENAPRSNSLGG